MTMLRLAILLTWLAGTAPGCRSVSANTAEWTVERAIKVIVAAEAQQIRGIGDITRESIECDRESFTDFYEFSEERTSSSTGTTTTTTFRIREIRFADIESVNLRWDPIGLLFVFLPIIGPWAFDVVVEMRDGQSHTVRQEKTHWWHITPLWIYPADLIHAPTEYGRAIDFMRQHAQGPSAS
jgi:hypothetical protein